ncbi:MAG TPA: tRNA (guanosine(46)-N7)-methyltransferase TrmB [Aggregatilineales bacterium]|nr:tRNA (guanosine(46)-N7)-methyltransferase TrmB [Aggregatilineales bacterium]
MPQIFPKLSAQTLPWPVNWPDVFGTPDDARPLILEIGFGMGHYLHHLAARYPDAHIVGLEIALMCIVKAEKALARGELPNVRVVFGRAETALNHLFTPESLDQVHINFPDPWFKARHSRRRLMQRDTLDALVNRLKPGGRLLLATDIRDYADMSAELLAATPALRNLNPTPWTHEVDGRTVTKYERRALEEGRVCHYFAYERRADVPAPDVPVLTEKPMPHLVIHLPLNPAEILAKFQPHEIGVDGLAVNYIFAFHGDRSLLFEVYVHEPTIEQRSGLMLTQHDHDPQRWTLRLSAMGSPRPTEGMHLAVRHLGEWLLGLHPDAHLIREKLKADSAQT